MSDAGLAFVAGIMLCAFGHWIMLCAFGHWIFGGLLIAMALAAWA